MRTILRMVSLQPAQMSGVILSHGGSRYHAVAIVFVTSLSSMRVDSPGSGFSDTNYSGSLEPHNQQTQLQHTCSETFSRARGFFQSYILLCHRPHIPGDITWKVTPLDWLPHTNPV